MVRFQKLTRNLVLILHGHNVHRQHRQLSKFLMRYQQFVSHAYCGAAWPVSKMASQREKAFWVLRFEVSRSVITVQREFRARFRKDPPCMVRCGRVSWEINFLLTFQTAPFFCVHPVYKIAGSISETWSSIKKKFLLHVKIIIPTCLRYWD